MNVIKFLPLLSLLIYTDLSHAVTAKIQNSVKYSNSKALNNIRLTYQDKQISHNLNKLLKVSKNSNVSVRLLRKLSKNMQKSKTFFDYKIWPDNLIKTYKQRTLSGTKNHCDKMTKLSESDDKVVNHLTRNLIRNCFKKYINLLSRTTKKSLQFHKDQQNFFQNNTKYILDKKLQTEVKYFLTRFKVDSNNHKFYSNLIFDHYVKNNSAPSSQLIRYMSMNPTLTRYVQKFDLASRSTKKTFYREFTKLTQRARDIADGEIQVKNKKKAVKRAINQALNYFESTVTYQPRAKAFQALLSIGKSMQRRGYTKLARKCYLRILKEKKDIEFNKVIFEYMWTYAQVGDYEEVLKIANTFIKPEHRLKDDSKLSFWIAYSHLKEDNKFKAHQMFEEIIRENPLSYYAILGAKLLSDDKKIDTQKMYLSHLLKDEYQVEPNTVFRFDTHWLKRVKAFSYVGNNYLINLEIQNIRAERSGLDLRNHLLAAANELSKQDDFLESFKIIYRSVDRGQINIDKETLKILFPRPYFSQIKSNANKKFDPIIALALIRQESGFNRFAKSHVGARGLMQLMPGTARRFRRVSSRQLFNAYLNINIGTKFFDKLMTKYENNLVYSLAAYNAGMRRIDDWKEHDYVNDERSMLNNIENIPFLETRKYVKLIFRNIFFYKMLIESHKVQDSDDFNKIYDIHVGFNK